MEFKEGAKQAIILGAGARKCFDRPVGFLEIQESSIIERLITLLNSHGIEKITIVTGYKKEFYEELAKKKSLDIVYNERYKWTGTMHSLSLAAEYVKDDFLLIESDIVFEERVIENLLESDKKDCMVVTSESGSGDEVFVEIKDESIYRISKDIHQINKIDGEFTGISKISIDTYQRMLDEFKCNKNPYVNYEYIILNISKESELGYIKIDDLVWSEIDTEEHYRNLVHVIYPKLLRKELEIKKQYVKKVVSEILKVGEDKVSKVEKLGGLTNKNFKAVVDGENLVVRIPGNGTGQMVDRNNEKINSTIAFNLGLDSHAIYFDDKDGLKISKFIENAETLNSTTAKREDNMELIAGCIKKLHGCKEMFKKTFDPFLDTVFYEKALLDANGKVFEDYYELKEKFMPLKQELLSLGMEYTPCHLDALPENFIKSGPNKIYLIDWEYSGNYDKLWDVITISVEGGYSDDEEELFFNKYFGGNPTINERKRMEIHRIMQDMCWSMWAAAKVAKGDDYLSDYALERYVRGKANLVKYLEKR